MSFIIKELSIPMILVSEKLWKGPQGDKMPRI